MILYLKAIGAVNSMLLLVRTNKGKINLPLRERPSPLRHCGASFLRHCEERSDEAISGFISMLIPIWSKPRKINPSFSRGEAPLRHCEVFPALSLRTLPPLVIARPSLFTLLRGPPLGHCGAFLLRHCEERSDEAISGFISMLILIWSKPRKVNHALPLGGRALPPSVIAKPLPCVTAGPSPSVIAGSPSSVIANPPPFGHCETFPLHIIAGPPPRSLRGLPPSSLRGA